jgi:hypothetical protein
VNLLDKTAASKIVVRNPKTGEFVTVTGAGALKDRPLTFRVGIDLTKPIAEQVLKPALKRRVAKG